MFPHRRLSLRRLLGLVLLLGLPSSAAVAQPDLTVAKSNNVGGQAELNVEFDWLLTVANGGNQDATISAALFLADVLPDSGMTYGTPAVSASSGLTGTVNCSIANMSLSCLGFSVALAPGGSFTIRIPTTPTASGTFTNPRDGGVCSVDLTGVVAESDETNNNCNSDTVVVTTGATGPDLAVSKSNDVNDATDLAAGAFTWSLQASNGGTQAASFSNGDTILVDNLPSSNIAYGTPTVQSTDVTGTIDCSISSSNLTCSADGAVSIAAATGTFTVDVEATPSASGTFVNPRAGGSNRCAVDPNNVITEGLEDNNDCANTVTVADSPDLTATKTNDTGGAGVVGVPFNWSIKVDNIGGAGYTESSFAIFVDNLPEANLTYGTPSVSNLSGVTGTIACAIESNTLSCTPSGGAVTLDPGGSFTVSFSVTPTNAATFDNPRSGGLCAADALARVPELREDNNSCSDSVVVTTGITGPDLTVSKTNDVGGTEEIARAPFTWTLQMTNGGDQDATFSSGQTLLTDELPTADVSYGSATVSNLVDVTGAIQCGISNSVLSCTADGADVTLAAGTGSFSVSFELTPSTTGSFDNPRADGICAADPNGAVTEGDENNNTCSDSVTVTASPDLIATKTNNTADVGDIGVPFTWTIEVENIGGADFALPQNFPLLVDGLPDAGLTYGVPAVPQSSGLTGTVECEIDNGGPSLICTPTTGAISLAPSGSVTISFTATPTAAGTYDNPRADSACVVDPAGQDAEVSEDNNECSDSVVVPPEAALGLTKTDSSDPVAAGDTVTYTVAAANAGPDTAADVVAYDVLPEGATFLSAGSSAGCTQPAGLVGLLAALDAAATSPPSGSSATARALLVLDTADNSLRFALATSGLTNTATAASLRLTGGTLVHELYRGSPGFDDANPIAGSIQLTQSEADALQVADSHVVRIDTDANVGGEVIGTLQVRAESPVRCALGAVALNDTGSASIQATVGADRAGQTLHNVALVDAATEDPDAVALPAGLIRGAAATESTAVDARTDYSLTKAESADPATAGDSLIYTLTALNTGPSNSTGATITDPLPSGMSFSSSADGCTEAMGTVTCPVGALAAGQTEGVSFSVDIDASASGLLSNTATVFANETDPLSSNNSATATTTITTVADLSIEKTDGVDPVLTEIYTYTLEVANSGPSDASSVMATDELPDALFFIESADGCTAVNSTVTCDFGTLAAGANAAKTFTVGFSAQTAPSVVTNVATVSSATGDPNSSNDQAEEMTTLDGVPPTVTQVDTTAATADGELTECESVSVEIQEFRVTFSESLFDPAGDSEADDVTNPDNYLLVTTGGDNDFSTTACGATQGDDGSVAISTLTYDDATRTATLTPTDPLANGLYRLLVCSALRDPGGNSLDGNGNGTGGDDFTRSFRVDRGNLLENGNFDCSLDGWTPVSTNPAEIELGAPDFQGSGFSGSAVFTNLTASQSFAIGQCVALTGDGSSQLLSGRYLLATGAGLDLTAGCEYFTSADCSGVASGQDTSVIAVGDTGGGWPRVFAEVTPSAGTASVRCSLEFTTADGSNFDANVDGLHLEAGTAPLFADDFESGDTSGWTATVQQ